MENEPIIFLGGTDTYGRFIAEPFPALVEQTIARNCVNLGVPNAGLDIMLHDPSLTEAMRTAAATVIEVVSPRNMSNRFYSVHPRRNDRFLKPSALLEKIFREVDFAEFNFTRHMLQRLHLVSPDRFRTVVDELQEAWVARMRLLLTRVAGRKILLWMSDHTPEAPCETFGMDPWFVTRDMLESLRSDVDAIVEVVASDAALAAGTQGMIFSEMELVIAEKMLGVRVHQQAAAVLSQRLKDLLQ